MTSLATAGIVPLSPSVSAPATAAEPKRTESHAGRLNWLRAGVLGANDGIVSVAALVVGVAGATGSTAAIGAAGTAGLVGGAISMALGEYVSVSSQSDSQRTLIEREKRELRSDPEGELDELAQLYEKQGLAPATARQVAVEFTAIDPVRAHLLAEHNIAEDDVVSAWHAAWVSAAAFTLGALLPFLAILLLPASVRIPITFGAVLIALAALGVTGAHLGGSPKLRASIRVVLGGAAALVVTFLIGSLLGTSGVV
ncbi:MULTISPECIES: VIT family protein [Cryobacterium]|uniref:VIT family protein n=1 Tax=Cryobacterium breve TaxID=1259258 RepID=A0ABY2IU16_9MICO|nr:MULTISPECIES: VIT family protein [Cryobacterium]TFC94854.1 VIT family protein [Cryobacterium breve]TFC94984.1 VIT family protein [Cryobacterium sp. TmT3-12]